MDLIIRTDVSSMGDHVAEGLEAAFCLTEETARAYGRGYERGSGVYKNKE